MTPAVRPGGSPWTPEQALAAHRVASRGRPYLYLASRLLDDPLKREAFDVAYASMRGVDDAVDERTESVTPEALRRRVARWLEVVRAAHAGEGTAPGWAALAGLFRRFDLPFEPWEKLAAALAEDVGRAGFEDLDEFLRYAEGAAVGPGRVFAMLVTAAPAEPRYAPHPLSADPVFARLARFTYLVHGLRDLARDLDGPMRGTALAPRAELRAEGLSPETLAGAGFEARNRWVLGLARRARDARAEAAPRFLEVLEAFPPQPAFVLEFLVGLYERQLDLIEAAGGDVFSDAHRMGPGEVTSWCGRLASARAGAPPDWEARLRAELETAAPRA